MSRAPHLRTADLGVRAMRRPRPPTVLGRTFPTRPRPEAPWSPPGLRAAVCPRYTGRARATDRRSDGGAPPYERRSRPGTTEASSPSAAVTPETSRPYKYPTFSPPLAVIATPPRHPRRLRRAAPLPAFHGRATTHVPSLDPVEPSRATCCPSRARVVARAEPPRPTPPVLAVRPRRRILRPNFGHPWVLGELMVEPDHFPDREHCRFDGIGRSRAAPMAKGHIARLQAFSRCFVQSRGICVSL
jgi:hypothetical protein